MVRRNISMLLTTTALLLRPAVVGRAGGGGDGPLADLAGEYILVEGLRRQTLCLTPEGGVSLTWPEGISYRSIGVDGAKLTDGHLILPPARDQEPSPTPRLAAHFVPVRWAGLLYLVPSEDGARFCNTVNLHAGTGLSCQPRAFLRDGDRATKLDGMPVVPKAWEPMILKKRLKGKVIEPVGDGRVRVDFGAEDGAWKGMNAVANPGGVAGTALFGLRIATVVEVARTSCIIDVKDLDGISAADPGLRIYSSYPINLDVGP